MAANQAGRLRWNEHGPMESNSISIPRGPLTADEQEIIRGLLFTAGFIMARNQRLDLQ